jgi:hypothetical protein
MCVNGKMRLVEGEIKVNDRSGKFKYDIVDIL